jgi:hypothetical protein
MSFIFPMTAARLFAGRHGDSDENALANVVVETLGREHSAKTGIRSMHFMIAQQGPMPSGLELSAMDPRATAAWMNEAIATYRSLQKASFTSTIDSTQVQYHLYEADQVRALYSHRDSVGQLLTFTQDTDKKLLELFNKQQEQLSRADVIHAFISCPADDRPENIDRLKNDLTVLTPYLRGALTGRKRDNKLAVALIVSRPDGAFATAEDARASLTDERLRAMLHRLVRLLEGSERVGLAAIFATSAFGYGKARRLDAASGGNGTAPPKGFSLLSQGEPDWILKEGELPDPDNLTALVWWSIMAGLLLKKAGRRGEEMAGTAQMLIDDLKAMKAWYVPLNCRPVR